MTIWDNIYKSYQKGGEAWATLSEEIDPRFQNFIKQRDFRTKSALDIGCGTGKYLKLLQGYGFRTDGIDSSETAVTMTKKTLNDASQILCVNMFETDFPQNKYDLVLSVSTIHHGTKKQVDNIISKIHASLLENGMIFITVPAFESNKKRNTSEDHEELEVGTYASLSGPEKGLPHSFYTKPELEKLFSQFHDLQLDLDEIGRWFVIASK